MADRQTVQVDEALARILDPARPGGAEERAAADRQVIEKQIDRSMLEALELASQEPTTTGDIVRGVRTPAIVAGSLLGGAIGAPAGPPGIAVGGALGAAAGDAFGQSVEDIARIFGVEGLGREPSTLERFTEPLDTGVTDLGFSGGAKVISGAAGLVGKGVRAVVGKLTKLSSSEERLVKVASDMGVELNLAALRPENTAVNIVVNALSKFPALSAASGVKASAQKIGQQVLDAKNTLFLRMGPTIEMAQLGIDLTASAVSRLSGLHRNINKGYQSLFREARRTGATVSSKPLYAAAMKIMREVRQKQGVLVRQDPNTKEFVLTDPILDVLTDARVGLMSINRKTGELTPLLAPRISLDRLDGVSARFSDATQVVKGFSKRAYGDIQNSVKDAWKTVDNAQLLQAKETLDKSFSKMMGEVQGSIGQKLGRIQKEVKKLGSPPKPGTVSPDGAFKLLFTSDSPQGLAQLRRFVGQNKFNQATGAFINQEFNKSLQVGKKAIDDGNLFVQVKGGGIDVAGLRKSFGLSDKSSLRYSSMKEALKGSPVNINQLEDLVNVVDAVSKAVPGNMNVFVARRAVLGGVRGLVGGVVPGLAVGAGVGGGFGLGAAAGLLLMAKAGGTIVTNPRLFTATRRLLDPTTKFQVQRAALMILVEGLEDAGIDLRGDPVLTQIAIEGKVDSAGQTADEFQQVLKIQILKARGE